MSSQLKSIVKGIPVIGPFAARAARALGFSPQGHTFESSSKYWDQRYQAGKTSGSGSYGELAKYKAEVLNAFVEKHGIQTVIEFGCGDGNQLLLARYPNYIGFDVSPTAIELCTRLFAADPTKRFAAMEDYSQESAELVLSLDVIYHLVEDSVFEAYMATLFRSASRFVIIYASNDDQISDAPHVRHRRFTDWIEQNAKEWKLIDHLKNPYPYNSTDKTGTFADFYIFAK